MFFDNYIWYGVTEGNHLLCKTIYVSQSFYDIEGNYITKKGKSYKRVPYNLAKRISHNNNW